MTTFIRRGSKISFTAIFFVTYSFFQAHSCFSQTKLDEISFDRISIPGSIRSSQVSDLVQDKDGVIWVTGGGGLYRYDGFKFTLYTDVEDSDIKLNGKEITATYYDSLESRIVIATRNHGLMQYNYSTNSITRLVEQKGLPAIHQFTRTADGILWAASFNNGLFYAEKDTLKRITYLPNRWPSCIMPIGKKLFVGQLSTVFVIEGNKIVDSVALSSYKKDLPVYTRITSLFRDRADNLWIGTERQGLFVYDLLRKQFVRHLDPTQPPFFSRINKILQDRDGLIWILTKGDGLAVYDPVTGEYKHFQFNPASSTSITGNNCFSILEDNSGIIWIGAIGDVNKYDRQKTNFQHFRYNPLDPVSLSDNMVRGVYEDKSGKVWIGTDGGYINLLDRNKKSLEVLKVKIQGDPLNYVPMYFLELNSRIMLIGSSLGLLQYDVQTKKFSRYAPLWEISKNKMVRQLVIMGDELYFIFSGNLVVYNLKTKALRKFNRYGDPRAFNVSVMSPGTQNRMWLGVRGGVSVMDMTTKEFRFIPFEKSPPHPDADIVLVLSVQEFNNKVYAGTFNTGLWEIDIPDPDKIPVNYTEKNGFQNNTIYSTIPDEDGNLWVSSNNGLLKFNPENKRIVPFTVSEGLQDEEFNRLAFFKNAKGEMIFGGINGINIFHPKDIQIVVGRNQPVITNLVASDPFREIVINSYHPGTEDIQLDYEQNYIAFHFLVANYHEPKRSTLFYKLDQFDTQWREVHFENSATYSNLKPGSYTFNVKSISLSGDEEITKLAFTIVPPWWKTWWFLVLSFCVIAFFVMTIIRSYIRKAQFDKQRLETLLKIRTYEIEQSKEELMALNQKKDLIFSILSHDLRSPLTTLKGFLGILIDNSDFLSKEDVRKHAVNIRNSVTNSLDLIDNTLFWSLSQMGNIQYTPSNFHIKPVIEKVMGLYQLTAEKKMIRVSLECDEAITVRADENMVYVTLRNILSNAIKFTREGKSVKIVCTRNESYSRIEIEDEGIGMSADYLNKVLSMEQPMLKKGTSNEKGTGLGLLLCKNFLEINNGKLHITSVENKGTIFTVKLPLYEQVTV